MSNIKSKLGSINYSSSEVGKVDMGTNDNYVVYINWDGFAWYYYELANSGGIVKTPVINDLIQKGVIFKNAYTGIPSITNPMQSAIVSGAWPNVTRNCYRYYDKKQKRVIQFRRENKAETIAEAAVRQGIKVASVHQFILENRGCEAGNADRPYITLGERADYEDRFDAAIKLIKGEAVGKGKSRIKLDYIPKFISIYMDDLDGLGHNNRTYGIPAAQTEEGRLCNVMRRLKQMDEKLCEFIDECKGVGIYDNMSFVLTADHGMTPYGRQDKMSDCYAKSMLLDLIGAIERGGFKTQVLSAGESPKKDTDIVLVGAGLQIQLSFTKEHTKEDLQKIMTAVLGKEYIGRIMEKDELAQRGAMDGFADLLISPRPPYSFKANSKEYIAKGQHDSLDETSQHIFSLMWGRDIKKGYNYTDRMYNIDFARTIAHLLKIDGPKCATGNILTDALI